MIETKNKIRNTLSKDGSAIILCFILSFFVWFVNKMSKTYEDSLEFNLKYELPEGMVLREKPPDKIQVKYSGLGWDLLKTFINAQPTDFNIRLSPQNYQTITGPEIVSGLEADLLRDFNNIHINLQKIALELEESNKLTVPIKTVYSSSLPSDYHLSGDPVLSPDSVTITGAESLITGIEYWPTKKFTITEINPDQIIEVALDMKDDRNFQFSTLATKVKVIPEQITGKSIYVPVRVKNAKQNLKIFPERVMVKCQMGLSQYDELDSEDFILEVTIPENNIDNPSDVATKLEVQLLNSPSFVQNVQIIPPYVEYFIIEEKVDSLQ
jgi:hypothetical protein